MPQEGWNLSSEPPHMPAKPPHPLQVERAATLGPQSSVSLASFKQGRVDLSIKPPCTRQTLSNK